MSILFDCQCGKRHRARDGDVGRPVYCSGCGQMVVVPEPLLDPDESLPIDLGTPSVESRLAMLEGQVTRLGESNGRLRWLTGGAFAVSLACSILAVASKRTAAAPTTPPIPVATVAPPKAAPPPITPADGIIEARGLVIRDETGRIRATLGYDGPKAVGLKLFEGGRLRSDYLVWDNGVPSTNYYYFDDGLAFSMGGGGTIPPSFDLYDISGGCRVQFGLGDQGDPNFSLHHSKIRTRFQLGIHSSGIPYMDFFDQKDKLLPILDKAGVPLFYGAKP
jgi:hypothetical protein